MEVTKALSEYIANLKFSDLPKDVVEGAKLCFLDALGVTLSGAKEPLTHILAAMAEEQGGKPQATLIGRRRKASLLHAALINGSASHALDFDDVHMKMMGHPSVPIFPAILALGDGDMGEESFVDSKVRDPKLVALREKVTFEPDPGLAPTQARIQVRTRDGQVLEKLTDTLDLSKDREKMKNDLIRKFRGLSAPVIGMEKTEKLTAKISKLEKIQKVNTLTNLSKG